jgi:hypothetical protein
VGICPTPFEPIEKSSWVGSSCRKKHIFRLNADPSRACLKLCSLVVDKLQGWIRSREPNHWGKSRIERDRSLL